MFIASDVGEDEFFDASRMGYERLEIFLYQRCVRVLNISCKYNVGGENDCVD